jgi:hypothetical protein
VTFFPNLGNWLTQPLVRNDGWQLSTTVAKLFLRHLFSSSLIIISIFIYNFNLLHNPSRSSPEIWAFSTRNQSLPSQRPRLQLLRLSPQHRASQPQLRRPLVQWHSAKP